MQRYFKQLSGCTFFSFFFILFLITGNVNAQLVTNGSFETTEPGAVTELTGIEGWLFQLMDGAEADFQIVADTAQKGNHSLKIITNTPGTNQWSIQAVADSIPVIPGETYSYSIWAKAETAGAQVNFTVGNYAFNEYEAIRPATLTTEWQNFTMEFTVDDDQTVIRAPVHFNYNSNVGNAVYIDNLVIKNPTDAMRPVIVEAESGNVGSDFSILQDGSVDYVAIQTNSVAYNPGSTARVISFEVTFADTGTYDLFARLRVGSSSYDDDSFFYGNGFGEKEAASDSDWIFVNGLASAGFSGTNEVVLDAGVLGSGIWKWVNLSHNAYQADTTLTFTISGDSLTKFFQIGAREDGLEIDKIAFGKSYLYYTVGILDNAEPGSTVPPGEIWEGPPLASGQPRFVGNVYSLLQSPYFEAYWNQVTPENASKWGSVERTRDNMNWDDLDAAYNFAKENDFPFHFHVLIWGSQQPSWISSLPRDDQLDEITEWFEAVAERYEDIDFLEVVNEPLENHNPPDGTNGRANYKGALGGDGETGWDWVLNAFRMARDIFPSETKLMLNDFSIISSDNNTSEYLEIVRLLQAENLIDIIGEQAHAFTTTASVTTMKRNLDSLAATGLPIQITEFDIDGPTDEVQLQDYQRVFPLLYEHPGVEGITLWGWRRGLWRDDEGAYLINQDGSERPAMEWLRQYLDTLNLNQVYVEYIPELPDKFHLYENYPNPFNSTTRISYTIPERTHISLKVYNLRGEEVAVLVDEIQPVGQHAVTFDAKNLASGVYLYRLKANDFSKINRFTLLK